MSDFIADDFDVAGFDDDDDVIPDPDDDVTSEPVATEPEEQHVEPPPLVAVAPVEEKVVSTEKQEPEPTAKPAQPEEKPIEVRV